MYKLTYKSGKISVDAFETYSTSEYYTDGYGAIRFDDVYKLHCAKGKLYMYQTELNKDYFTECVKKCLRKNAVKHFREYEKLRDEANAI